MLWTLKYMEWIRQQVQFEQPAQEYTRLDSLHEVEHANDRVRRLEEAIREAVKLAPRPMQEVMQALQALRGIAQISALTIVSELGQISRFAGARQLMGYSGAVASEDSSGKRVQRGAITKTGNASSAPGGDRGRLGIPTPTRDRGHPAQASAGSQRGSQRNCLEGSASAPKRYRSLAAAGKNQQKVVTALGRELLGFIWAIGVKVESNSHHRTQVAA